MAKLGSLSKAFLFAGVLIAGGVYWINSPSAVVERRWDENKFMCGDQQMSCRLVTKRLRTGDRSGKSNPYDTLVYDMTVKPVQGVLHEENTLLLTAGPTEVWFINKDNEPAGELTVRFKKEGDALVASGDTSYTKGVGRAHRFVVVPAKPAVTNSD